MLICPICRLPLSIEEKRAVCPNGHSFDRARQGYFNLLPPSGKKGHGDDAAMLLSRRQFLDAGYYEPLARFVSDLVLEHLPSGGSLLDAGCGEGYYTAYAAKRFSDSGKEEKVFAFDIAKDAVRMTASRMEKNGFFFVASAFHVPVADACIDLAMSLFSPYAEEEFLRVVKKGGYLLRAVPLEDHLFSLKKAVYDEPKKNEKEALIGAGFSLVKEERLRGTFLLKNSDEIEALFGMTPYVHKTGREDMEKLKALTSLETEYDFGVLLYQKN